MKRCLALIVFCCCAWVSAQEVPNLRYVPKLHQFRLWNTLDQVGKLDFFVGFTNGFLAGSTVKQCAADKATQALLECVAVNKDPSYDQAIAMIDKYYRDNPEKWNIPIGDAIVEALTVKGGPCPGTAPQK